MEIAEFLSLSEVLDTIASEGFTESSQISMDLWG